MQVKVMQHVHDSLWTTHNKIRKKKNVLNFRINQAKVIIHFAIQKHKLTIIIFFFFEQIK